MEITHSDSECSRKPAVQRLAFTLCFALMLIVYAVITDTHYNSIEPATRRSVGFSPYHIESGDWSRLLSSIILTVGGWKFYASLGMILLCVGAHEWKYGSIKTALAFIGFHLATMLTEVGLLLGPLSWIGHPLADVLYVAHDVGPSAGYYGCLGVVLAKQFSSLGSSIAGAIFALLIVRLWWSIGQPDDWAHVVPADLAHLIAFPLGLAVGVVSPPPANQIDVQEDNCEDVIV